MRLLEEGAPKTSSEWSILNLKSRDMQWSLKKNKSQVHLTGNCADHTMSNHRGTVLLNQLHTGLLLRVRTGVRGVTIDHSVASPPLRQLQPSPQATPYLLDATPTVATFDSPAPATQPFWHTHCTWKEACKPLHAFDVFLYQCGLMPVHTRVSH